MSAYRTHTLTPYRVLYIPVRRVKIERPPRDQHAELAEPYRTHQLLYIYASTSFTRAIRRVRSGLGFIVFMAGPRADDDVRFLMRTQRRTLGYSAHDYSANRNTIYPSGAFCGVWIWL